MGIYDGLVNQAVNPGCCPECGSASRPCPCWAAPTAPVGGKVKIIEGEWRTLDDEAPMHYGPVFRDAGACYACGVDWGMNDRERHVAGCERLETPVGSIVPEGQCPECGTINNDEYVRAGICSNEGGCRRWGEFADESTLNEPVLATVTVVNLSRYEQTGDLNDLPF